MALIKHANTHELTRDAIVLDLGDLSRQGQALIESARARADQILAEARDERDRIVAGSAEKGLAQGLAKGEAEGLKKGQEDGHAAAAAERKTQIDQLESAWRGALEHFGVQRDAMLSSAHVDVLRLATLIATKVVKRVVAIEPRVVEDQMRAVLATVTRPTELMIRVSPADLVTAQEALPGLLTAFQSVHGASIEPDAALGQGSCIATTRGGVSESLGGGEIDASIDGQLYRIVEALLPGHRPPPEGSVVQAVGG